MLVSLSHASSPERTAYDVVQLFTPSERFPPKDKRTGEICRRENGALSAPFLAYRTRTQQERANFGIPPSLSRWRRADFSRTIEPHEPATKTPVPAPAAVYAGIHRQISDEEWELTFRVNIHAMFYLTKAAVPHMKDGGAIINTASINADKPNPTLLAYATTKGAIQNFTAGLAQLLAEKGIRANAVAPGPIWTPLIPSTMSEETVEEFGKNVPMKRPGQPAELATAYVMLADPLSSYVSGATIAVTGGKPIL